MHIIRDEREKILKVNSRVCCNDDIFNPSNKKIRRGDALHKFRPWRARKVARTYNNSPSEKKYFDKKIWTENLLDFLAFVVNQDSIRGKTLIVF